MRNSERLDVYERTTISIIAAIEAGAHGCRLPWHHDGTPTTRPTNAASEKPYRGINTVSLWAAAEDARFPTGLWATYRQWSELGAQVRKGERGSLVVFWKFEECDAEDGAEEDSSGNSRRAFARGYTVFNAAQVEGYVPREAMPLSEAERIARAEQFCRTLQIEVRDGGSRAFYSPAGDFVGMPRFETFRDAVSYYAVLLHECGHASGAPHRLNRDLSGRFGSTAYAMEEITVELLSAMICADLSLSHEPRSDHAGYIATWLEVLRADKRAIFTAASKAQQIADWMHKQQECLVHPVA